MATVNDIVETTGQKRGVVEQFRNELQKYNLIGNNEILTYRAVEVFKNAILYRETEKDQQLTWAVAMQRAIQEEYGEEMMLPFEWSKEVILQNLIRSIKIGTVKLTGDMIRKIGDYDELFAIYCLVIDNFKELGKTIEFFKESRGTDGNPMTTFELTGDDFLYYVVGKWNAITKSEDIHVFYNEGLKFNIMRCKHICGGSANKGLLAELWEICSSNRPPMDM